MVLLFGLFWLWWRYLGEIFLWLCWEWQEKERSRKTNTPETETRSGPIRTARESVRIAWPGLAICSASGLFSQLRRSQSLHFGVFESGDKTRANQNGHEHFVQPWPNWPGLAASVVRCAAAREGACFFVRLSWAAGTKKVRNSVAVRAQHSTHSQ